MNENLFKDFVTFSAAHLRAKDAHPEYPVLKQLYADEVLTPEVGLWRTLLEVTWDNVWSAEQMWLEYPEPMMLRHGRVLKTSTARRMLRGSPSKGQELVNAILTVVFRRYGSLASWVSSMMLSSDPTIRWKEVRAHYERFKGNGTWASYKFADLMKNVHGYNIEATDIGLGGGFETTGPVVGLAKVMGVSPERAAVDRDLQWAAYRAAAAAGVPLQGMDQFETCCCNFNSMTEGRLYVGLDIDEQLEVFQHVGPGLKSARMRTFEPRYLGEMGGWSGPRKALKTHYVRTGEVLT